MNKILEKLIGVREDMPLAEYTTFKIGGPAKYFYIAKSTEELIKALEWAKDNKIPILVLGGGSNVLISDKGFKGLVIKIRNSKFEILNSGKVYAEAGVDLGKLAGFCAENSLSGLEWGAGVPGTLGGAIYGNAQAFGTKMSDMVESVEVLNVKNLKIKELSKEQCEFSLKGSAFKKNKSLIITSCILGLNHGNPEEIKNKIKDMLRHRKERHPINFPSAGSVFVNTETMPVWQIVKECGLAGKKIGQAQVSEKHCNFIINVGGAKAADVVKLIKLIKAQVKKKFKINLKTEIQLINLK